MRTLLIDADVLAFKTASAVEVALEWEPGYWTWHCHLPTVLDAIDEQLDMLMEKLEAQAYKLCLTDSAGNFRKDILPTYKGNRKGVKRPLVLMAVREWMIAERGAYLRPKLEGDDVMGILSTGNVLKGEKVIVSIDKDMKTIPGLYCRDLETGIVEVSEEEADYWHLYQTLVGDQTDGYAGCPGLGPKKVIALFEQHGANWNTVVSAFEGKGFSEEEALVQARVARILRASDYDFKNKEPILWLPT